MMAASKPVPPQAGSGAGLPRWQLALLVGTPLVLGAGALYLWSRSRAQARKAAGERKTPEGSASPQQGQDGPPRTGRDQDGLVGSGGAGRGGEDGRGATWGRASTWASVSLENPQGHLTGVGGGSGPGPGGVRNWTWGVRTTIWGVRTWIWGVRTRTWTWGVRNTCLWGGGQMTRV